MEVGEGLHPGERGSCAPRCEGACAEVFDGLCFPGGFHSGLEVLDEALLAARVAEGAIVVFVGKGRGGEDLLYGTYVVGLQGGKVSFEVGQSCVELPVTFIVNVTLLQEGTEVVFFGCSSFQEPQGSTGKGDLRVLHWRNLEGPQRARQVACLYPVSPEDSFGNLESA